MLEYADSCLKDNCQFGFKPYPSNNVNALNPCFLSLASVLIAILLSIIVLLQFIELFKIKKVPPNFKYKKNHVLKYFSTSYIIHISNVALYGILVVVQYALFINNEGQAEYTKIIPPITKLSLLSNIIFIVCFSIPSQLVQYFKTSAAISGNLFYFMFSACLNLFQFSQRWFHLSDKDMYNVLPGPIAGYLELGLFIVSTLCLVYLTAHYEPSKVLLDYYKEKGIYPPVNFFQSITFTWMNPLITDVYKKGKIEDPYNMPLPPCNLSARECTERLRARWEQELWDNKDNNDKKSSIVKAILKTFGGTIACAIVYEMLQDILSVIEPLVLRTFIKSFTQEYREQYPLLNSLFIVLTLFGIKIISTCLSNQFYITIFEAGLGIRSSLMCMVYQKGLKLSVDAREQKSSGDILNLASVDVLKIQRFFETSQGIFGTPIQLVGVLLSLYSLVGRAVFGGLVVMIIMAPINSYLSKKLEGLYRKNMEYKDTRTKLITEILNSIKSIKLYAWETPMLKKLFHVRNDLELENFKKVSVLDSFILFAWNMVPIMVSTSTFLLYAYLYNIPLTPDIVFPALSLFDLLGDCIYIIPNVITDIIETKVSIERLRDFLLLDEIDDSYVEVCDPSEDLPALEIQNCTFLWGSIKTNQSKKTQDNYDEEAETTALKVALKNIDNFKVVPGELTCIVGRVGAGKTTLLKAILGELPCTNGSNPSLPPKMIIRGTSIAFCPQQPWVMNSSVKDNIIFGHRYEEKFYKLTLKACQLLPDLEILPDGDQTMVGEKGISLSGGQKARLVLARAVYSRSDIYLLDDVLSAVDAEVSSNIIQQVLSRETGILKNKTIILATNAIKVLRHAQNIYALNNGEIVENGTYSEIMRADSRNSPLKKLIQEFASVEQDGPNISEQKQEAVEEQRKNEQELAFERANDNIVLDDNGVFQEINDLSVTKTAARSIDGGSIYSLDTRRPSMASFKRPTVLLDHEHDNRKTKQDVEKKEVGKVKKSVYLVYIKACGYVGVFFFFVFLVSSNLFNIVEKLWLKYWSEKNEKTHSNEHLIKYASIYMGICITDAAFSVLKSIVMMFFCSINASKYLHDTMAKSVLSSPMTFFETTPVGRIINRFTADIGSVDSGLHFIFSFLFRSILNYCFTVIVIGSVLPWFIVFNFVILLFYFYYQVYYIVLSRDLKRLMSNSFSPIMSLLSETLMGHMVINAYKHLDRFSFLNYENIQFNINCVFNFRSTNRWLSVRLQSIGAFIVLITGLLCLSSGSINKKNISSGTVGLLMSFALQISNSLMWIIRMTVQVETNIVCVERIKEYCELKPEAEAIIENSRPPKNWPDKGEIVFEDYTTKYRENLDPSLKKVSVQIKPREKVGIVGRTGAGKSTLTLALFRLLEATEGRIMVDGIDISKIGLADLRSRLSIIPQDAQAFEGTVRYNLDPFDEYTDSEVLKALELSHLKAHIVDIVKNNSNSGDYEQQGSASQNIYERFSDTELLACKIGVNGDNLSVGQKQLLCLSRALLNHSKVLVLDEATAAVDMQTDKIIQETIRSEFQERTILTIAHRLDTVMDSDRIMVLDKGEVKEFDTPANLLARKDSLFYALCEKGGYVTNRH